MAKRRQSVSLQEEDAFKMVIDELMESIVWHPDFEDIDIATDWLLKMVDYNVPHGKQIRGRGVISAYKSFVSRSNPSKAEMKAVYVLGWCVELFAAAFYIPEDIITHSIFRRGKPCWHLIEDVGKGAVNDAFMLKGAMEFILDQNFRGQPTHKYLVRLFHKCFFNTCLGQNMDSRLGKDESLEGFTMENYYRVSKYKIGYFSFYLPVAIAKIMSDGGKTDEKELLQIEEIALAMGHLFQVQDDYLDCFGQVEVTGRKGTTIECNRNSWFVIRALEKGDLMQLTELKKYYGKRGRENVQRIIKLFEELNLPNEYEDYEMKCYKSIRNKIEQLPASVPTLYFTETLDLIVKREK